MIFHDGILYFGRASPRRRRIATPLFSTTYFLKLSARHDEQSPFSASHALSNLSECARPKISKFRSNTSFLSLKDADYLQINGVIPAMRISSAARYAFGAQLSPPRVRARRPESGIVVAVVRHLLALIITHRYYRLLSRVSGRHALPMFRSSRISI